AHDALLRELAHIPDGPLSEIFAAQLAERLRNRDPRTNPAIGWLEERLAAQGASVETVVRHAQDRLGASNLSLRNVITAFRTLAATNWNDLFEQVSLVEARLRDHPGYGAMDFLSRNLYRSAVEDLARGCDLREQDVADHAVRLSERPDTDARHQDPGWYLIDGGHKELEAVIGFRPPLRLSVRRLCALTGLRGYLAVITGLTLVLMLAGGQQVWAAGAPDALFWPWMVAMLFPLGAAAIAVIDLMVARSVGAALLPGLDLKKGVPSVWRTMVVMPVILTDAPDLRRQIESLEIPHLSGTSGDLTFALLTDGADAPQATMPQDAALSDLATSQIARLNALYPAGPAGPRFLHLHRARRLNPSEGVWMGWERKRGKLHELNLLLRGDRDTSFVTPDGGVPQVPADIRFVITLDADTRLPRDAAARLIGKMAHPLNRPVFDDRLGRVTSGYGVLQPRITPSLAAHHSATIFERVTCGPGGMDPYATASSDVYQDLFGEGSFAGKGIYDVDAFQAAMRGRIGNNRVLSHDLLEGIFARAGLASDIQLIEAFPDRHDIAARRQHRWTRGDWQLLAWLRDPRTPALG
ncbi:MAG: glycosyl transferase, partial [Paracoccus sp. (in: a-proteobacteria)]|nr:glycosyl transferase [Paracoccus sp. (in: a-proteobacteria)]